MPTATRLISTTAAAVRRSLTAEQMFIEAWKKVSPNADPPKLPLTFRQPKPPVPGSIPSTLILTFRTRYSDKVRNEEVDMVTVPAITGRMGILPGDIATMAELNPGLLSLHRGSETTKYFISGGFALIHPNSVTDIITAEVVPLDRIDPELVQKGLSEFSQKLRSAITDYDKAEAQIGVDVHTALSSALTG